MLKCCEICAALVASGRIPPGSSLRRLRFGERIITLCDVHYEPLKAAPPSSLEELRGRFVEPDGKRSLVGRRSAHDRRVFPPRPEGRRAVGRRGTDPR